MYAPICSPHVINVGSYTQGPCSGPDSQKLLVQPGTYATKWIPDDPGAAGIPVDASSLIPVPPSKKDIVRFLRDSGDGGAKAGAGGSLIGIDTNEGIVKLDKVTELVIVHMSFLGKVVVE